MEAEREEIEGGFILCVKALLPICFIVPTDNWRRSRVDGLGDKVEMFARQADKAGGPSAIQLKS